MITSHEVAFRSLGNNTRPHDTASHVVDNELLACARPMASVAESGVSVERDSLWI